MLFAESCGPDRRDPVGELLSGGPDAAPAGGEPQANQLTRNPWVDSSQSPAADAERRPFAATGNTIFPGISPARGRPPA